THPSGAAAPAASSAAKQCCSPRTPRYCIRRGIIPKLLGWAQQGSATSGGAVTSSSAPRKTNQSERSGEPDGGWTAGAEPAGHWKGMPMEGSAREPRGGSAAQAPDQAGGVPAPSARLRDLVVEPGDRLGDRQLSPVLLGRLRADAQVLSHPVDREAEVEL